MIQAYLLRRQLIKHLNHEGHHLPHRQLRR
nr:MAG TPA: hypothetical protein [Caudoviricetes sp.]